ncbi:MAG: PorP/SprF family type IX secretion system membrane protein [Bacteroidia bacterium]|nr:PorP/SprF family type IX secretion system membrane protein [Bacteroidia bacterium]
MKLRWRCLLLLLIPAQAWCQGGIGSMPFANPALLSPALAGLVDGNFGVDITSRTRRATLDETYTTSVVSIGYPYYSQKLNGGLGALVYIDGAGGLTTREAHIQGAWEAPLGRKVRYDHLRAGFSIGLIQLSVDNPQLIFADQFNAGTGGFTGVTSETIFTAGESTQPKFDASIGLVYYRTQKIKGNQELNYYAGFGMHRLTRPNLAFSDASDLRVSRRLNVYGGAKLRLRSALDLNANFVFQQQNNSELLQLGAFGRVVFYEDGKLFENESAALLFGLNTRLQLGEVPLLNGTIKRSGLESMAPFMGLELARTLQVGVAAEIILSDNSLLTSSYGGLQVMLSYLIGGKTYNRPALPFPTF